MPTIRITNVHVLFTCSTELRQPLLWQCRCWAQFCQTMINNEYADLVTKRQELGNKKNKTNLEEKEYSLLGEQLTKMELQMDSKDIIESVRDAWKHIPDRD